MGSLIFFLIYVIFIVGVLAGMWKTFEKAGQPGWTAIIPILNIYVLVVKIAKMELWYFIVSIFCFLFMIPVMIQVAEKFGKSAGFGVVALWLFGFVGFPILGFGEDTYQDTPEPPLF